MGTPNLGWMYHLTLTELQVLYALSKIWQEDRDPEIAYANDFDHMYRLTVRKLTNDTGYEFRARITVDEALEVWIEYSKFLQHAKAVQGFLQHMATCVRSQGAIPWPSYETAFRTTQYFLADKLPQEHALIERVREEIVKISDVVTEARLNKPTAFEIDEMLRQFEKEFIERTSEGSVH